jgi:hypothetical protein
MIECFLLWHTVHDRDGSEKLIGIFDTEEAAKKAMESVKDEPGFKSYPDGFLIDPYLINKVQWTRGFGISDKDG